MMKEVVLDPSVDKTDKDDEMVHLFCQCSPERALCGKDLSTATLCDEETECIVCAEFERVPCERCGE